MTLDELLQARSKADCARRRTAHIRNPSARTDLEHLPPEELVASIIAKERRILELMEEVRAVLEERP